MKKNLKSLRKAFLSHVKAGRDLENSRDSQLMITESSEEDLLNQSRLQISKEYQNLEKEKRMVEECLDDLTEQA